MIRLPTAALAALRNRLAERGARPSISFSLQTSADELLEQAIVEQYGPLCDAMYLMMAADGELSGAERDVVRGALRELDDRIRSRHVEALIAASADALSRDGVDARFEALRDALSGDVAMAEAAALLAAAVAYADGEIASAEDQAMARLMGVLGVAPERMRALMVSLERMDTVIERDASADAADVTLHAAIRLRTPEDFERLSARADRPDMAITLRLYAAYAHSLDALLDQGALPRSAEAAAIEALSTLSTGLPEGRSPHLDELRKVLADLAAAASRVHRAPSLSALCDGRKGPSPIDALDEALSRLSSMVQWSLSRLGVKARVGTLTPLGPLASRAALDQPGARDALVAAVGALSSEALTVPRLLLAPVSLSLAGVGSLPLDTPVGAEREGGDEPLPDWLPKSQTLGGFFVVQPLGEGGAASVFVAVRADEKGEPEAERYALKVPHYDAVAARSVSESEYLSVFKREAGALLSLPEHPNLAGFVTFDARARPKPFLVMELVRGINCQSLMKERSLGTAQAFGILDGVLAGLSAMHEVGVGHLDVKPSNVVLRRGTDPVLVDFGLAGRVIRTGCATPPYASPEVWGMSDDDATPMSADIYSFGCLAYELLTGRLLFEAASPLAVFTLHVQHDGDPPGVRDLAATKGLEGLAAMLTGCLRRSARLRPGADELRGRLSSIRGALEARSWPLAG